MKPVRRGRTNPDLFRERLDAIIDMRHGLVRLAGLMPWSDLDESFGKFFKPIGRPAKPTRLMVGLHYLKHTYNLSDEEVVERWVENSVVASVALVALLRAEVVGGLLFLSQRLILAMPYKFHAAGRHHIPKAKYRVRRCFMDREISSLHRSKRDFVIMICLILVD